MGRDLASGTVSFLFSDVEGSTKLLHKLGPGTYADALGKHRVILRNAFNAHGGVEVDTQGDSFFIAFARARDAVAAAHAAQAALASGPVRVRMGIHTGIAHVAEEGYVGAAVHLGARIAAAGHGGQVLLSHSTRELVDAEITDLGEHRLKDFVEPVWLFQLGSDRFPPLKTISNTNLPRPASSFVGREREVEELLALMLGGARLLTLSGAGGSGKTRLALEAAAVLVPEFKGGVFWVGLATLRDPSLVLDTIAQTLGAKDGLAEHIGARELLLLLDNLEQVIEAAPELASLVEACPNLGLLVTSRERLRVRGEVEYPVPVLAEAEAVELFCARSQLDPEETIAELCRRLDNLPLAVELAAARTSVLSPRQILGRLAQRLDLLKGGRDADPRQQTLRATIEWSHELLGKAEQRLFARLGLFRGGCTLGAAEDVAEADLDVLQSLVDKSLLRHTGERFWMLETIREFAAERLEESGAADELRRRFADHYVALAEEAYPNLRGDPKQWLDRLETDHDNLRATFDGLKTSGDTQRALRLAAALYRFWYMRGHLSEGRTRLEHLLARDDHPTPVRARALNGAAVMAHNTGDDAAAKRYAKQALALHERFGDAWEAVYSRFLLGLIAGEEQDYESARHLMAEGVERFRELGDDYYAHVAAVNLGYYYQELGELERARDLLEDLIRLARGGGDERSEASALGQLSVVARLQNRNDEALPLLEQSLRIWLRLGDRLMMSRGLRQLAHALALRGDAERAAKVLSASEALREKAGAWENWYAKSIEEALELIRPALDHAAFERAWSEGRKLSPDEALALINQP